MLYQAELRSDRGAWITAVAGFWQALFGLIFRRIPFQEEGHIHAAACDSPAAGLQDRRVVRPAAARFAQDDIDPARNDDPGTDQGQEVHILAKQQNAKDGRPDDLGILHRRDDGGLADGIGIHQQEGGAETANRDDRQAAHFSRRQRDVDEGQRHPHDHHGRQHRKQHQYDPALDIAQLAQDHRLESVAKGGEQGGGMAGARSSRR